MLWDFKLTEVWKLYVPKLQSIVKLVASVDKSALSEIFNNVADSIVTQEGAEAPLKPAVAQAIPTLWFKLQLSDTSIEVPASIPSEVMELVF